MSWNQIRSAIEARMISAGLHGIVIEDFLSRTWRVHEGETGLIDFSTIGNLDADEIMNLESLPVPSLDGAPVKAILKQVVVIRLNGGLGTSMGLNGPKTLLPVREGMTFLDIILNQLEILRRRSGVNVPLLLMNSFSTDGATRRHPGIETINHGLASTFLQNRVPRLNAGSLLPIGDGTCREDWCPPGHGDIFLALRVSGLLDALLAKGIRYAFISNGDNLGATFHSGILLWMREQGLEFVSEVTPKTPADIKGGVLVRHRPTGRILLLETAQVPPERKADIEDVSRFPDFNINNLWVDLEALSSRLNRGPLDLSLIVNPKDASGTRVLQLESAMGAAIGQFSRAGVIRVPRSRFAPVKNCSDLLVRRSDACILDESGALVLHPDRHGVEPIVSLDDTYKNIQDFERLVPVVPSLRSCRSLTVKGSVLFNAPLHLEGDVFIENPTRVPLPPAQLAKR